MIKERRKKVFILNAKKELRVFARFTISNIYKAIIFAVILKIILDF